MKCRKCKCEMTQTPVCLECGTIPIAESSLEQKLAAKNARYEGTDYGFRLIIDQGVDGDKNLGLYGMVGFGQYEHLASCLCTKDDDLTEFEEDLLKEMDNKVCVCRRTKHLLSP